MGAHKLDSLEGMDCRHRNRFMAILFLVGGLVVSHAETQTCTAAFPAMRRCGPCLSKKNIHFIHLRFSVTDY